VFINGKRAGILDRRTKQDSLTVTLPKGKVQLDILVENLGRINFGPYLLKNTKGITDKVTFAGTELKNWKMFGLPFDDISKMKLTAGKLQANEPVIKKGTFKLDKVADTYLDMSKWGKGVVWVNGHNLGRYWNKGPQQTLYLPAEWLKKSNNNIVVLELIKPSVNMINGLDKPILDQLQ
jgi:beta-galactosidase